MVTPQPMLQHQPTRQRGTETSWAREMMRFTRRQHSLSKVSGWSPHLGPREEEHLETTRRPDRRVPEPGQRQLSTRQTAADLWSSTGMAPRTRDLVLYTTHCRLLFCIFFYKPEKETGKRSSKGGNFPAKYVAIGDTFNHLSSDLTPMVTINVSYQHHSISHNLPTWDLVMSGLSWHSARLLFEAEAEVETETETDH